MILSFKNVSKSFGTNLALNGFTAELGPGIHALLGPNGSGKTTLLHYDYLYRNKWKVINAMRLKGTLQAYLKQFDADAQDSFEMLVKRIAEAENVTEELKAFDQMEWVRKMNGIRNRAEEFILNEYVYQ